MASKTKDDVEAPEAEAEVVEESQEAEVAAEETPAAEAPAPDAPSGTAYLDHDDPNASASFGGVNIVRDAEGLFLVPLHAVEELVPHGFRLIRGA